MKSWSGGKFANLCVTTVESLKVPSDHKGSTEGGERLKL